MGFLSKVLHPFSSKSHALGAIFDPGGQLIRDATNRPTTPQTMLDPLGGKSRNDRPTGDPSIAPGLPGSVSNPGGYGSGTGTGLPMAYQPPVQYPQLTQLPYFLPNPQGYGSNLGGMPFIRNQVLGNTLGPLTQPNYGIPIIPPSGPGQAPQQQPLPIMSGGFNGGLGSGLSMPGSSRWGIQPIRGAIA
jgi:hypothetical protein